MSTATASVDVGALSAELFDEASQVIAGGLVLTMDHLEEDERPLNQLQKIQLVHEFIRAVSNLEATYARTLINRLEADGVQTWGLHGELERILGKKSHA